jgi:hypothetical protein
VSGAVAAGHDVLTVSALPLAETQYDFVVNDRNEAGGIVPCMKTYVEAPLTTFEIFDPNAAGGIIPCMHVAAERLADGSLGPVEVAVEEPDLSLVVRIGALTYRLVDGRLVEV